MANMIIVASKIPITSLSPPQIISPPNPTKFISLSSTATTSLTAILTASLSSPLPLLAEEFKKAQLFDFDQTLPIIMAEFLILMFALDKVYYSLLGKFIDERDATIKDKLGSEDTSAEVKQLEEQATTVVMGVDIGCA